MLKVYTIHFQIMELRNIVQLYPKEAASQPTQNWQKGW